MNTLNNNLRQLMRTTPQQLRAFEATVRLQSVTQAAVELHVTQPTVSVQLRELAQLVGEPLFQAAGRRIQPTQAAVELAQTVAEIAQSWQRLDARLAQLRGLIRGRLALAAVTTAEYFVPDLVGPFAAAHPGVEIELAVENRDRVVERLQRGVDELTVMMLPPTDLPLERKPFLDNPLVVIASSAHPLASRKSLRLSALSDERWLMRESGSGTRLATQEHFAKHGFAPRVAMSLGSNEAVKHSVAAGLGVAVVSKLAVAVELQRTRGARLVVLPVQGFPIKRRWFVVWRKDRPLSAAARGFMAYLQEQ
jgi:LysR family transcriptional regulator, low CO2-responsive transcriptional regulator